MPLQVLQRYDQSAENPWKGAAETFADTLMKKKQIESQKQIAIMDTQAKMKATQNDVDKEKYRRRGEFIKYAFDIKDLNATPEAKMQTLKSVAETLGLDPIEEMSSVGEVLSKLPMSSDASYKDASRKLVEQDLGIPSASTPSQSSSIDPVSRVNAMTGLAPQQTQPTEDTTQMPTAPARQNMITTGYSAGPGGVTLNRTNLEGVMQEATAKTTATEQAKRNVEMQPIRNAINFYLDTFEQATQEVGGLESTAITALAKGKAADVWANIGNLPATQALQRMSKSLALQLGSYLNKGRPTEQDAQAAAEMLLKISLSKDTNQILRSYLQTVMSGEDMYVGRDRKGVTHMISPAAEKIWDAAKQGSFPKEKFTIREKR